MSDDEDFEEYLKFYCHQNKITSKMTEVEQFEIWKKFKILRNSNTEEKSQKRKTTLNIKENETKKRKSSLESSSSSENENPKEESCSESEESQSEEEEVETIPLHEFCSLFGLKEKRQVKYVRRRFRDYKKLKKESPKKVKDFHNLYHLDHESTIGVLNILFKDEKSQKIVAPKSSVEKFMKNYKKK
jgi:hypothetical protein